MSSVKADSLDLAAVEPHLAGRFGTPYRYEPVTESTQLLLLGSESPEGAVAVADHQTGGRGRHGRAWQEPPASSILVSVLLHPPAGRHLPELSLVAAVATAQTVEDATALSAQIKWPNDVMLNRRKVAGIISELSDGMVVVGIGINVNQERGELPLDAPVEPGSLRTVMGRTFERAPLLGALLHRLELQYDVWRDAGLAGLYAELGPRDFLRGRRITIDGEPAIAIQILRDGRLEIETTAGEKRAIESGEVRYAA